MESLVQNLLFLSSIETFVSCFHSQHQCDSIRPNFDDWVTFLRLGKKLGWYLFLLIFPNFSIFYTIFRLGANFLFGQIAKIWSHCSAFRCVSLERHLYLNEILCERKIFSRVCCSQKVAKTAFEMISFCRPFPVC